MSNEIQVASEIEESTHIIGLSQDSLKRVDCSAADGIGMLAEAADELIAVRAPGSSKRKQHTSLGHHSGCPCCSKFFQAVCADPEDKIGHEQPSTRQGYRQIMPSTPPGFWNVGFTQEDEFS